MTEFCAARLPDPKKIGVYFFGELHDADGDIHWNIGFLNLAPTPFQRGDRIIIPAKTICFFDPVATPAVAAGQAAGYDWDSRTCIADGFSTALQSPITPGLWLGDMRAQQSCTPGSNFTDLFCQSWCLMFLGIFCNEVITSFLHLNFVRYQFQIVKSWVLCTLLRMKEAGFLQDWGQFDDNFFDRFSTCLMIQEAGQVPRLPLSMGEAGRWIDVFDDCWLIPPHGPTP